MEKIFPRAFRLLFAEPAGKNVCRLSIRKGGSKIAALCLLVFCAVPAFSQSDTSQFVIPRKIFVGDIAELNFNFRSSFELFEEDPAVLEKELPLSSLPFSSDSEEFTIHSLILKRNGQLYTAVFKFTPWTPGSIRIPVFDLLSVMGKKSAVPLEIVTQPVDVQSILAEVSEAELKSCAGPLLLPGTIYLVWGMLFLFVALLALSIVIVIQREKLSLFLKNLSLSSAYARNSRRAQRELKRLENKSEKFNAEEFALLFQKIMRKYLSERLGFPFETITSSSIVLTVGEAFGGFLEDARLEAVEELEGAFRRADYIRFAGKNELLSEEERKNLIQIARSLIMSFEKPNTGAKDA